MEFVIQGIIFAIALAVLLKGADFLIGAAEKVGLSFGISPFIIGVTIVAAGTSLPELASSIFAVVDGQSEIVMGNVVGSNIANVCLVLGLVAIVSKTIHLNFNVFNTDMPLLIISAFLLYFVVQDKHVSVIEALLLLAGLVVFLANSFTIQTNEEEVGEDPPKADWKVYAMLFVGGVMVYLGAQFTVNSISNIATFMNVSNELIAVTVVAFGTSLPEIVVSIQAAKKGNAAIAIGNVLGSNIFNTYAVVGIPALIGPLKMEDTMLDFNLPFMIAITFIFALICIVPRITRWEGWMLVIFYLFFVAQSVQSIVG